jgi:plastocyanin
MLLIRAEVRKHFIMTLLRRVRFHAILVFLVLLAVAGVLMLSASGRLFAAEPTPKKSGPFFLPTGDAAKIVTVTEAGEAEAGLTILSAAVTVRETGPGPTVKKFGEVYAFDPSFVAVHREQPTQIEFWNLQPDDEHDFALLGPDLKVLMYVKLPPLQKISYTFTFHKEGLIDFKCLRHQPAMSGQILVLPPLKN